MHAHGSLTMLHQARQLVERGEHTRVLELLGGWSEADIEESPSLALLLGISHARLGRDAEASRWVAASLRRSRERGDQLTETRALNVSGAIALEAGRIDEAAEFFSQALAAAEQEGDQATVGRCSNNLGIIANMRGDHGRAIGSYTMALAAFQRAGLPMGAAEALHNLAITYRDQGNLTQALATADRAIEAAETAGDQRLSALVRGGRAEIRLLGGEAAVARREIERVIETERKLGNVVGEAEDRRVWACALAKLGEVEQAESALRDVIEGADAWGRPLLAAQSGRDLSRLLVSQSRWDEARAAALTARSRFEALGADAEAGKLDALLDDIDRAG